MGHQSYVVPFDTDEQLQSILDVIKLHNSSVNGYTNEFVRYHPDHEFRQLEVGEELTRARTVAFKDGKAYKCPNKGPCLARAVLVSHGGGRASTFPFLRWHLRRAMPDVYVNCFHAIEAYGYESTMEARFLKASYEQVDNARIGVLSRSEYTDAMRETDLLAEYTPMPAKFSTRRPGEPPAEWTALMGGITDRAELKKRKREHPRVSPYSDTYETVVDGWVLEGERFATEEAAKNYADHIRPAHVAPGCVAAMRAVEANDRDRNNVRFLSARAEGKMAYTLGGGSLFWLTREALAERLAEGQKLKPTTIDYEDEDSGEKWKKASVEEIEAMLAAGKDLVLHNC